MAIVLYISEAPDRTGLHRSPAWNAERTMVNRLLTGEAFINGTG